MLPLRVLREAFTYAHIDATGRTDGSVLDLKVYASDGILGFRPAETKYVDLPVSRNDEFSDIGHKKLQLDGPPFDCPDCEREFESRPAIRSHYSQQHKRVGEPFPWVQDGTPTYRYKALHEYGEVCKGCGATEDIIVHHIDGDRENNDFDNLVPLCWSCHGEVHAGTADSLPELVDAIPEESMTGPTRVYHDDGDLVVEHRGEEVRRSPLTHLDDGEE